MHQLSRLLGVVSAVFALFGALDLRAQAPGSVPELRIDVVGRYATGLYDATAAEIAAYDPATKRLYITNSGDITVDILDIRVPSDPVLVTQIDVSAYGNDPTHVDFKNGLGAVGVKADPTTDPGTVLFFDAAGQVLGTVTVGAGPDATLFTPDGLHLLVCNEGEPNGDYTIDPEGSVSVISIPTDGTIPSQSDVRTANFHAFDAKVDELRAAGVRIFGPKVEVVTSTDDEGSEVEETVVTPDAATVSQDFEPEYAAISPDSMTAWVTIQEANALAVLDIAAAQVTSIIPLGYKSHILPKNKLDASNENDAVELDQWPVRGMYMPDWVNSFVVGDKTYLVSANEGDSRDYDNFSEETRVGDLALSGFLGLVPGLQDDELLGRLLTTTAVPTGKESGAGPEGEDTFRDIYSFGARSFSVWTTEGELVYDSGDEIERITAEILGNDFNSNNNSQPSGDSRSDDKGPEPEGVVVAEIGGAPYAFVGLERVGGVIVFNLSNPEKPTFATYVNYRNFDVEIDIGDCADCEDDCNGDCIDDCESCKEACRLCADCPEGEDCTEACARCEECGDTYDECEECSLDCPAVAGCAQSCFDECFAENCPIPGDPARDPLDLGPEGLLVIPEGQGPEGYGTLLVVTNEISGSTTIYSVDPTATVDLSGAFWAGPVDRYTFAGNTISTRNSTINLTLRLEGVDLPSTYAYTGEMLIGSELSGIGVTFNATASDYNRVRRFFDTRGDGLAFHLADAGRRAEGQKFEIPPVATWVPFEVKVSPGRYQVTMFNITRSEETTKEGAVGLWSMGVDVKAWRNLRVNGAPLPVTAARP